MKKEKLSLLQLSVKSFVTTLNPSGQIKGGTLCPEQTFGGPTLCITGSQCNTRQDEGCHHSTGNTDNPTGGLLTNISSCVQ